MFSIFFFLFIQVKEKESQTKKLQEKLSNLHVAYDELDHKYRSQFNLESVKWDEFERMADQMKQFTRSMSPIRNSLSNTSLKSKHLLLDDS